MDAYKSKNRLNISKKSIEKEKLKALRYTQTETTQLLRLRNTECRMLEIHSLLSPFVRVAVRPFFKKDEVDRFRVEYISVKELAMRLNTSNARLRRAIRNSPLINSWDDQAGCLFLVKTADIAAIQECLNKLPAVNRKLSAKRHVQTCNPRHVRTMDVAQAAQHLKTHSHTVIYYRDLGLIKCANNNTLQFSISDIETFQKKYSTCEQLAKELKTSQCKVSQLLEPLKIYPISGGITNGHPLSVYDRSTLPQNLKELINPTHDTFGTYWMRDVLYSLNDAAQQLGILHSDFRKFFTTTIRPARAKHYRPFGKVSPDEIGHVRSLLASYSKLSTLLISRGIKHAAFSRRFIHPKFVQILKINNEEYLSLSDLSKLEALLDKYCTPDEAGAILRLSSVHIYLLRKQGLLTSVFLPEYNYKHPLFERAEILNLLKLRTSKDRQRYSSYPC